MRLFRRDEITVRSTFRGMVLSVPDTSRLVDDCPPELQPHLRRRLAKTAVEEHGWLVAWCKQTEELLRPRDIVAVLRCDAIVVELAYGKHGVLVERLVGEGDRAAPGAKLARLGKAAAPSQPERPHDIDQLLRHFVARQRSDAETISRLEADLAEYRRMTERLSSEVYALRAGLPNNGAAADPRLKRLKHEFSKRFHPDARPAGDAERAFRELVFREF